MGSILSVEDISEVTKQWKVQVTINDKPVALKIDSGSDVHSLPRSVCESMAKERLKPSGPRLIGYFGQRHKPRGKTVLGVSRKGRIYPVVF